MNIEDLDQKIIQAEKDIISAISIIANDFNKRTGCSFKDIYIKMIDVTTIESKKGREYAPYKCEVEVEWRSER